MDGLKVLVFHGYLLRGTGSNVYNASLAQALARLGHEVHLLCQDRAAASLPWVDRVGTWEDGRLTVMEVQKPRSGGRGSERAERGSVTRAHRAPDSGGVTVHLPDIGGLLPVYVYDSYEGFEVKTFADLDEDELDAYLEANVAAVRDVAAAAGGIDAALANHLVMGPAILARAGFPFAAKIHGSALEFTVRPNPGRFLPYAREGIEAAGGVLVGSRHTAEALWGLLDDPELPARTRLGPPGVDTELFAPLPRSAAIDAVRELEAEVDAPQSADQWGQDSSAAAAALEHWASAEGPRAIFVGKLIASKGVDLLLAAWPLVVREHPGARLLLVGFGQGADVLRRLWGALEAGDVAEARTIAAAGLVTAEEEPIRLRMLDAFLAAAPDGYEDAARGAAGSVAFAGRLEHDQVARVLPAADALVFPSTFPEAFGMVAAEAAACGVLPVSADHSGAREVSRELAASLPPEAGRLLSFPVDDGAVQAIAERLNGWLALDAETRAGAASALVARVHELWSWESVARGAIDASLGRVEELPGIPE